MKELKISISDELYEELSNVPDKDSFLIELLEDKLKISGGDNTGSVECSGGDTGETCSEEPLESASIENDPEIGDQAVVVTDAGDNDAETSDSEDTGEEIPDGSYFEPEDVFEEEDIIADNKGNKLTLCCSCSLMDPDLEDCTEPILDVDFDDPDLNRSKSVPILLSPEKENTSSLENMPCFQSIIVDLTDRVCELEKQIIDINANVRFLKERSILSDMGGNKAEPCPASLARSDGIVKERPEGAVPYATLSFPELKFPPELLSDAEVSFSEPRAKPLLFDVDISPLDPEDASEKDLPFFSQANGQAAEQTSNPMGESPSQAAKPKVPVPDAKAPVPDKLESCIFAYLPSGSEVKKDVIKSLLSKRYLDNEVESKIDQLLSAGKISNIVKDDKVYLMRIPEKDSA
ncbi:hypothetical protein ACT9XH_06555 [Methanococcoides methylutens]|uniref:hypothetical protein n=1 Tax=Methanococcoides methylutens TaxID=2226 RepID=UPI0040439AA1